MVRYRRKTVIDLLHLHADYCLSGCTQHLNIDMNIIFGAESSYIWVRAQYTIPRLKSMEPVIRRVTQEVVNEYTRDDRTLFVVMACPCCEWVGHSHNIDRSILVAPYRGMDLRGLGDRVKVIGVDPPIQDGGTDDFAWVRQRDRFILEWRRTLHNAIRG